MMKHERMAEPPSYLFMVGQDSHGNWVAQNQSKTRGGLFGDRIDALRFVRSENANRTYEYIAVTGLFELDMARTRSVTAGKPFSTRTAIAWSLDLTSFKAQCVKTMLAIGRRLVTVSSYARQAHKCAWPVLTSAKSDIRKERVYEPIQAFHQS